MLINQTEDNFVSKGTSDESVMSWTVEYIEDRRFIRVVIRGVYNIDDHMRMLEDVVTRDFWTPGINLLIDESNLDYRGVTLEQLREAGTRRLNFDARIGGGKTAVVLNSLADFARARQYELITSGKISAKIEIFRKADKALEWLLA
jgi:hypothetical protein